MVLSDNLHGLSVQWLASTQFVRLNRRWLLTAVKDSGKVHGLVTKNAQYLSPQICYGFEKQRNIRKEHFECRMSTWMYIEQGMAM